MKSLMLLSLVVTIATVQLSFLKDNDCLPLGDLEV